MRAFFLLIIAVGIALGLIYPWAVRNFSGDAIGTWSVYENGRFKPVSVPLKADNGPVRMLVDLTTNADRINAFDRTVLTITAAVGGRTVLAKTLHFSGNPTPREQSPQLTDKIFREEVGPFDVEKPGVYVFTIGPGDADNIQIKSVSLNLRAGAAVPDERGSQIGFGMIGVGIVGLMLAIRLGGPRRPNDPDMPPKPRWGRAGSSA